MNDNETFSESNNAMRRNDSKATNRPTPTIDFFAFFRHLTTTPGRTGFDSWHAFVQHPRVREELLPRCAFHICRARHRGHQLLEDLKQEALIELRRRFEWCPWLGFDFNRSDRTLMSFVTATLVQCCSDAWPKVSGRTPICSPLPENLLAEKEADPVEHAVKMEAVAQARMAIAAMPGHYRVVMELVADGTSTEEIAHLLKLTRATVHKRRARGRNLLLKSVCERTKHK